MKPEHQPQRVKFRRGAEAANWISAMQDHIKRFWLKAGLHFLTIAAVPANAADALTYERDIAPILRSYCAGCHNDTEQEGGLSVETYARLLKGGGDHGSPVKPGDSAGSFLMRSISGAEKPKMPPKDEPQLPAAEIGVLSRWIASGASGPKVDVSILQSLTAPSIAPSPKPGPVTAAAYSPDGQRLAIAQGKAIEVREAAGGKVLLSVADLPGKANAVHFTADGSRLIIATGITGLHGVAQLRDVRSGALLREFAGHSDALYDAEISPNGEMLATAGYDRTIRLWKLSDGSLLRSIDVHKGAVFDLAWHPDGRVLASASADETVKLWRAADGVRLDTLNQPQDEMWCVLFTPDGRHIIGAGKDRRIHLWQFVSREAPALNPPVHSRFAHESPVTGMAVSGDGRHLLSSAGDRTLKLWSLPDLELENSAPLQPDISTAVLFSPQAGVCFTGRMDGSSELVRLAATPAAPEASAPLPAARAPVPEIPATAIMEAEPSNLPGEAVAVPLPSQISGAVSVPDDADLFRFRAAAGAALTLEVNAARSGSKLDSRLEILMPDGTPVKQAVLQATRDSWFTFRGKDSDTADDFRLHNWAEMELNEYLYANGEVVKLWLYPRGPDSGFKVYPGTGRRHTWFGTPALVHALGAPAYVVTPLPPGTNPAPNGLPVFHLNYVNDDDPSRRLGADSIILFDAPADGEYLVKLTDVRGFGGPDFTYSLTIRPRRPDFKAVTGGAGSKVSPGSGREITFSTERMEGFDGPVRIEVTNLPPGFSISGPIEIEAGQHSAVAVLTAEAGAAPPGGAAVKSVRVRAMATIGGKEIIHDIGDLGDIGLGAPPKVTVSILSGADPLAVNETPGQPPEFRIFPGQTISARVRAVRHDFTGRIELGGDDSGRNLPHGLYVDNIGLNGLLIVEGQTEREFFITASKVAMPGLRPFHLRATADGGQASSPVMIRVLPPPQDLTK